MKRKGLAWPLVFDYYDTQHRICGQFSPRHIVKKLKV